MQGDEIDMHLDLQPGPKAMARPLSREEMTEGQFASMLERSFREAKENDSEDFHSAVEEVRRSLGLSPSAIAADAASGVHGIGRR